MQTKNLKNIVKAINKLKLDKVIVNDMAGVLIKDGYLYARNLEAGIRVKIDWDGGDLFIDNNMWKKLTSNFKEFTIDMIGQDKIFLKADGAKITIPNVDVENYPIGRSNMTAECSFVMEATKQDLATMARALGYVGVDELRPAMMQVALNNGHIVATDAHKLLFVKSEGEIKQNVLIRPVAIQIMNDLGWDDATIYLDGSEVFMSDGTNHIWFRLVDEKYPNWEAVIPENNPIKVQMDSKTIIEGVKQAMVFANQTTKRVAFNFNGCATIKANDLDFEHEYSKALDGFYKKYGTDIEIGFNGSLLTDVLKDIGTDRVEIEMSIPSRASLINNEVILMPVMLNAND